jgi:hypothetical protein
MYMNPRLIESVQSFLGDQYRVRAAFVARSKRSSVLPILLLIPALALGSLTRSALGRGSHVGRCGHC